MSTVTDSLSYPIAPAVLPSLQTGIELIDGSFCDISQLGHSELTKLQFDQETAFAAAITRAPKDSDERSRVTKQAYTTVCAIIHRLGELSPTPPRNVGTDRAAGLTMGMDPRYIDLVVRRLEHLSNHGSPGGLFEIGFSSGAMLEAVASEGFAVGGIEVVDDLLCQAKQRLHPIHHAGLLLGDFRQIDLSEHRERYSVVYWNDVFEHIATDEILDFLRLIHGLLRPGGELITITPNWHMRPSDVTSDFFPPRTEAIGFHLKEYSGREVVALLHGAGFSRVHFPAAISRQRIYYAPWSCLTRVKLGFEPLLEKLPYRIAVQMCRRFGLNCTVARK